MKTLKYLDDDNLTLTTTAGSLNKLSSMSISSGGGEGQRAEIRAYSPKSLRRLKRSIQAVPHTINNNKLKMITLTYHNDPDSPVEAKRDLDSFFKRLQRRSPESFFIWKLEYQKRGTIHYHILCYNMPFSPTLPQDVARDWNEITGQDEQHLKAGTRVEVIKKPQYISKYVGKPIEAKAEAPGRYWGIRNKKAYDIAKDEKIIPVNREQYLMMKRFARKHLDKYLKAKGVKAHRAISERNCYTFYPLEKMLSLFDRENEVNKDKQSLNINQEDEKWKRTQELLTPKQAMIPRQPQQPRQPERPNTPRYQLLRPVKPKSSPIREQLIST